MSLLKLIYIAHGWHLEMLDTPLFRNKIEAWQYGPVVPDVYKAFRPQGVTVKNPVSQEKENLSPKTVLLLEEVYRKYANLSPFRLSEITHEVGGPWETARRLGGWYAEIPDSLIKPHYQLKRLKAQSANA
jgi:uncharacterized phage-associated protein